MSFKIIISVSQHKMLPGEQEIFPNRVKGIIWNLATSKP